MRLSLNRGNYKQYLQVVKDYNLLLNNNIEIATLFKSTVLIIKTNLIKAIHKVILDDISR